MTVPEQVYRIHCQQCGDLPLLCCAKFSRDGMSLRVISLMPSVGLPPEISSSADIFTGAQFRAYGIDRERDEDMTDRQRIGRRTRAAAALLMGGALTAFLTGCGGGGGSFSSSGSSGTSSGPTGGATAQGMQVIMHDTPGPFQKLNVTVAKVTAVDGSGNEVTLTGTPQTFDVLALQNETLPGRWRS